MDFDSCQSSCICLLSHVDICSLYHGILKFGPLDSVRYNEDFVIQRFIISRFFPVQFTVAFARLKSIAHYTEDFVTRRCVKLRFH